MDYPSVPGSHTHDGEEVDCLLQKQAIVVAKTTLSLNSSCEEKGSTLPPSDQFETIRQVHLEYIFQSGKVGVIKDFIQLGDWMCSKDCR